MGPGPPPAAPARSSSSAVSPTAPLTPSRSGRSNTLGASGPSATVSGTPVAVPGAAVITDVAPIDRALRITASVADDGGSAVTGWEYTTDGGATWAAATGTASPFTVTRLSSDTATLLDNATSYAVAVRARNAVGPGGSSATVSAAPSATPSAPAITVTPGNGRIQVAYTIGSDGGSPLTDVQYRLDDGDWTNAGTITSPFTISGLTNGTPYAVTLRGVNSRGDGAVSLSASSTPRTVPGAPTAVATVSEDRCRDGLLDRTGGQRWCRDQRLHRHRLDRSERRHRGAAPAPARRRPAASPA